MVEGLSVSGGQLENGRRVEAKVEFHAGELFPRVGFIATNLELLSRAVVRFYNKRGTAEHWIKDGKQAVKMTRIKKRFPMQRTGARGVQWRRFQVQKGNSG